MTFVNRSQVELFTVAAIVCAVIAIVAAIPARATVEQGTPHFSWALPAQPPANPVVTEYRLMCDGSQTPVKTFAATVMEWQSAVSDFAPGEHNCSMRGVTSGGVWIASNNVNFTIPQPSVPIVLQVD